MTHSAGSGSHILAPQSKFYQGVYGRICDNLPAWSPVLKEGAQLEDHLLGMANGLMTEHPGVTPAQIADDPALEAELEAKYASSIPAGYTYFGQFIDHDITFDPASSLMRQNDPNGLYNHRTPRLDLDNVYGSGPEASPYLYDKDDKNKFLIGKVADANLLDLPRNRQGIALIGDMRNDENVMVSQLQLAFLCAHNVLVDRARDQNIPDPFERARTTLRWLYQYVVWNDFIRRIANDEIYKAALSLKVTADGRKIWELGMKDVYSWKNQPYMPVEFSVAAYRFGHSMVRNSYRTNQHYRSANDFVPIFDNTGAADPDDLRGFRPMKKENVIQWDCFLQMASSKDPFPQKARKIDTRLANALAHLHASADPSSTMNVLAFRNLMRGCRFDLPSGSEVARKFNIATKFEIADGHDALWYYILKEAESLPGKHKGEMLGRVGSTIVCATFAGLLMGDPNSYLNVAPDWTPRDDPLLKNGDRIDTGNWDLATIIRISGLPIKKKDFA